MKKTFLVILFATIHLLPVNAQSSTDRPSIEDTKTWILQKLNTYTSLHGFSVGSTSWSFKEYSFSFDNNNALVIVFKEEAWAKEDNSSTTYSYTVTIPMCTVTIEGEYEAKSNTGGDCNFGFYSQKGNISEISTHYGSKTDTYFRLRIDLDKEDDLYNRLKKAFDNLRSYCPPIKAKETF